MTKAQAINTAAAAVRDHQQAPDTTTLRDIAAANGS